jgi:hypothetical protein
MAARAEVQVTKLEDRAPAPAEHTTTAAKKPYKKPEFRFERVFETMALACGKIGPSEAQCRFNRKNS